jgi:uncharacterized protein
MQQERDEPVTGIRQHSERSVPDEVSGILAAGRVAHVGFIEEGRPYVIPFSYQFDPRVPDRLYLHGASSGRALGRLLSGDPVCVEVTLLDGLVYSRTAKYHSLNYRSAVCFGRAREITDAEEKRRLLDRMIARYFPGRTPGRDYDNAPVPHLDTTAMVEIAIEGRSAKARRGGPKGPRDADPGAPGTCGVIDLRTPE